MIEAEKVVKRQGKIALLPKCHRCGKLAEQVYQNEYWTYSFNEDKGRYESNLVEVEIRCPYCNAKLDNEFIDGVSNYSDIKIWIKDE